MATFEPFREVALLVKNGFSEDFAFGLDTETRAGFCIIAGELSGSKFDWGTMAFREPAK